jgi:hypothetical protein
MTELPYYSIPDAPKEMNASNVLVRLLDGIGFRYRWATEELKKADMDFQPCDSSMDIQELMKHIHGLLNVSEAFLTGKDIVPIGELELKERRKATLDTILRIRKALNEIDDVYLAKRMYKPPWREGKYPIWTLINGPLCDSLTHIGQIASWRRIHNNPIVGANVFDGLPPKP